MYLAARLDFWWTDKNIYGCFIINSLHTSNSLEIESKHEDILL